MMRLSTLLFLGSTISLAVCYTNNYNSETCEDVKVPMCKQIGYNQTIFPNEQHHTTQTEAGLEIHQFWPLVEIGCSPHLRFFLCSKYVPICFPNFSKTLQACRKVCEMAREGCEPVMAYYGFKWPDRFNCGDLVSYEESQSPENKDNNVMCMQDDNIQDEDVSNPNNAILLPPKNDNTRPIYDAVDSKCDRCQCNKPFQKLKPSHPLFDTNISTGQMRGCAMSCKSPHFHSKQQHFTPIWLGVWSGLCLLSTSVMVLTFLIDMGRFKYPERPIIFLSGCYMFVSIGFIIRLVATHEEVACDGDMVRYEISETKPVLCIIVFILTYFFGMASSIWWVILSLTWFLAAGLKWGSEAIANYSLWFHIFGWIIPAIQTCIVIFTNSVDGDPVSGICYVGNQSIENLVMYVLGPLVIYLIVGTLFLMAGFVSLFRIRHVIKRGGNNTDKLEKLMIRIGVFSVLYTVPATIVIACYLYEYRYREEWETRITCPCIDRNSSKPEYVVFVCKYFMCLVVGITSGFWIWTNKTVTSWINFANKLVGGREVTVKRVPMTHV
jgi:frizzled protein 5/8